MAAGAFKSFGEQFTRTEPSEANRVQMLELYESLYEVLLEDLALDSQLEKGRLDSLLRSSPIPVSHLQEIGLIEGNGNAFQARKRVQEYTTSKSKPILYTVRRLGSG